MVHNIIGAFVCALTGVLIAFVNYIISKKILEIRSEKYAVATVFRQIIQVGYLIAVYFIGSRLSVSLTYLLVGAVVGMTVPMLFFTKKLLTLNENLVPKGKKGEEDENG